MVNKVPPKQRDIAMVFQNYALYPHMTVRNNMAFSLKLARAPQACDRRAGEPGGLDPGAVDGLLDRYPRQLSGGQRQRVAMGRAIVRDPQVFLFDEPLSNLDAKLRVQTRAELKDLHQRLRTTTIYVTHDQIEAMTMADKIVVMNGGRVEQIGTPLSICTTNPANQFVAGLHRQPFDELHPRHGRGGRIPGRGRELVVAAAGQSQCERRTAGRPCMAFGPSTCSWREPVRGAADGAGGGADRVRDAGAWTARRACR